MLKQRILTAIVLLAALLPALFASTAWPFALLTLVLIAAAGWEWGRLNAASMALSLLMGLLLAGAGAYALTLGWAARAPRELWWLAALIWIAGAALALRGGPLAWPRLPKALRWVIGLLALWLAWLALSQARHVGINYVLSIMALVWAADIAAYAGGRAFGKRKLAPTISPGKSWEGVYSGVAAVLLLGLAWQLLDRSGATDSASVFTQLRRLWGPAGFVLATLLLSAMSVVGDLIESLVKRAAGAKDSSRLLPGHGGVLDRVDALLPVFPVAMALTAV
jgi:phosphatidate cytidylyltransferase